VATAPPASAGNPDAQSFANKLFVVIDGRSVYTPLFLLLLSPMFKMWWLR